MEQRLSFTDRLARRFGYMTADSMKEEQRNMGGAFAVPTGGFYTSFTAGDNRILYSATARACIELITNGVSTLDVEMTKKNRDGKYLPAKHNLGELFSFSPDGRMTAHDFLGQLVYDMLIFGAGYARIERNELGTVSALHYIPFTAIRHESNGTYTISFTDTRNMVRTVNHPADAIFVFRNLKGMGLAESHEKYFQLEDYSVGTMAAFFEKNARVATLIHSTAKFSEKQSQAINAAFHKTTGATGQQLLVMDGVPDLEVQKLAVTPADSGVLDALSEVTEAIARAFGVPAVLLNLQSETTFKNIEEQNIFFAQKTIEPIVHALEDAITLQLLNPSEQKKWRINFDVSTLVRGNAKEEAETLSKLVNGGIITPNEARIKLKLDSIEGGDTLMTPVNVMPIEQMVNPPAEEAEPVQDAPTEDETED